MLKGITNHSDLEKVYGNMGENDRFKHKKNGYLIKKFYPKGAYDTENTECKEVLYRWNNERMVTVKIENLHKHFEVVDKLSL